LPALIQHHSIVIIDLHGFGVVTVTFNSPKDTHWSCTNEVKENALEALNPRDAVE